MSPGSGAHVLLADRHAWVRSADMCKEQRRVDLSSEAGEVVVVPRRSDRAECARCGVLSTDRPSTLSSLVVPSYPKPIGIQVPVSQVSRQRVVLQPVNYPVN